MNVRLQARYTLLAAAVLALLHNYFFLFHKIGLQTFVFSGVGVCLAFGLARAYEKKIRLIDWLIGFSIVLLGLFAYLRSSPQLHLLNLAAMMGLSLLFAISLHGVDLRRFVFSDYIKYCIGLVLGFPLRYVDVVKRSGWAAKGMRHSKARRIAKGFLLAGPVVLVIGALFASADAIFRNVIGDIFAFELRPELVVRGVFAFGVFAGLGGVFWYMREGVGLSQGDSQRATLRRIGSVELAVVLGSLNAIFALFIWIQFIYLFGGESALSGVVDMTYAEYARSGFFQLLWVAVIMLGVLFATERYAPRNDSMGKTPSELRLLSSGLIIQIALMIASASKRLSLYEDVFGFTLQRFYAHAFIFLIASLFLLMLYKILVDSRDALFAGGSVVCTVLFVAALNLLSPDALIARHNLERYRQTGKIDVEYIAGLSADATGSQRELLEATPIDSQERQDLRLYLCQALEDRYSDRVWQEKHFTDEDREAFAQQISCRA